MHKELNVKFKAESNPLHGVGRLFAIAATITLIAVAALFSATKAGAEVIDFGDYQLYTTSSFCTLEATPPTGTLNAGGTQTFTFAVRSSGLAEELYYGRVPGKPPVGQADPAEVPPISKLDVWGGCVLQDISLLAGLNVKMEVISGPDAGLTFEALLQSDGTVTFPLVNNGVAGTDQVRFTIVLPEMCLMYRDYGDDYIESELLSDEGCAESLGAPVPESAASRAAAGARPISGFPTVAMTADAAVTWIAPPPVAASGAVSVTSFKSCVANRIRIRPSYSSGLRSAKLVVDGKTVQTKTSTSAFILNPSKYKAGKHRFKVIATYDSGTVTSNTGSFSKCKAKVSVKKVKPKFTG